ncbi:MAG: ATP synthase F0 subunit B [Verrucomicrobiales bacterium]|nr:ATP synthase F0 subunit B [Verrucomicrobiales bacterium]
MEEIAHQFGIEWPKLIAQILIFMIVYAVLKKKAFGPVLEILEARRARIAEGEAGLDKIKADLASAESTSKELIAGANSTADQMIREAKESAAAAGEKEKQKAVSEANQIITKAREAAEQERESLLAEMKRDFGRLVVETTSKVTGKVLTADDQKRINKETASQITL